MINLAEKKSALIQYFKDSGTLRDENIIKAFEAVPREHFVLPEYKEYAYIDQPLPILAEQTISQPTTVAIMTQTLLPKYGQKILEIGAGSGYQASILSKIVGPKGRIITVERIPELYEYARKKLKGYKNVQVVLGDGSKGYASKAPYDRVIVTASAPSIPEPLFEQLKERGILLIPVGSLLSQKMLKVSKLAGRKIIKDIGYFVFVPLLGQFGFK